jgi:hypothetical protein
MSRGYASSHLEDRLNTAYFKLNDSVKSSLAGSSFSEAVEQKFKEVRTLLILL